MVENELVKMLPKGQLVVPQEIREKEGFEAGDRFIPFEIKEGILFKKVKMPNIKQEFEKLSRDIQRRFQSTGVSKDDAKEAVKWARKK